MHFFICSLSANDREIEVRKNELSRWEDIPTASMYFSLSFMVLLSRKTLINLLYFTDLCSFSCLIGKIKLISRYSKAWFRCNVTCQRRFWLLFAGGVPAFGFRFQV